MDNSQHVRIKTKFKSMDACKSNVDKIGRSQFFVNGTGKLYGIFDDEHFVITSSGKLHGFMEFAGEFIESDEGIIMEGIIRKREDIVKRNKIILSLSLVLAIAMIMTFNPVFIFMAFLFLLGSVINMRIMNKNESFHKIIQKRFTE